MMNTENENDTKKCIDCSYFSRIYPCHGVCRLHGQPVRVDHWCEEFDDGDEE